MKSIFSNLLAITFLATIFISCKKDEEKTYINPTGSVTLTCNKTVMVLLEADENLPGVTFGWNAANFGYKAAITYTLQLCKTGTNWAVAATSNNIDMGLNSTKSFTVGQFDAELVKFIPAFAANDIDVRIKASVGDNAAPQYSNTVKIKVTPYRKLIAYAFPKALNVAGNYQGWSPGTAPQLVGTNGTAAGGQYEGYINFTNAAPEFKLVKGNDWPFGDHGMASAGVLTASGGNNITLPSAGVYYFKADRTALTYSATKINSWAIIGSATAGGWGTETPMTFDPVTGLYSITTNLTGGNEMKFRANNDWSINFGVNNNKLEYGGPNIPISLSGNYTITLDLLIGGNYDYVIKKN